MCITCDVLVNDNGFQKNENVTNISMQTSYQVLHQLLVTFTIVIEFIFSKTEVEMKTKFPEKAVKIIACATVVFHSYKQTAVSDGLERH